MSYERGLDFARKLDAEDPLASFRERFHIPKGPGGEEVIYLCGHSLGLQPRSAERMVQEELEEWKSKGVEGHFHSRRPWMAYHELVTEKTAWWGRSRSKSST